MPCASWRNPRVFLTLSLVFLCGTITGGVVMRYGIHDLMHKPEPFWQDGGREISLQRLSHELKLTPVQTQHLAMVLDDFMMYIQMLQAQMDEVRANGKERILRILNDEQKERFNKLLGQVQASRERQK